ncbi:MAG: Na(+)/H(+) antiporter subunit B [Candidatus Altiarchaeales archaeon]|nr:MAG: Na(+)/H(+) antiporter subunit B [Candidatus Altiarchaeales archaeon]
MKKTTKKQTESIVIRTMSRIMIPFIQLFGLYVIIHGEASPGGGFQGGVILGTSIILLAIVFDLREAERRMPWKVITAFMCVGLLIYSGIGLLDLLSGGAYLEYTKLPLPLPAHEISALSILFVEIGIGITVMAVIILLFYYLVGDQNAS